MINLGLEMAKFDPSCGLTRAQIEAIKYRVKRKIGERLPFLPERVELKLFFEGRDAWVHSWRLLNHTSRLKAGDEICLEVTAKLKIEFHQYQERTQYEFLCKVDLKEDLYRSSISINRKPS
jgi:hypothetical protein